MKPVLILFGTNAVSYNVAAALTGANYYILTLIPENGNKLNRCSNKFNRIAISKYKWDSNDYVHELIDFVKSCNFNGKILTFLTNDQSINFYIKYNNLLSSYLTTRVDNLEKFYNKELFYKELENIGVQYPETCPYQKNTASYPYLVKPYYKHFDDSYLVGNQFTTQFKSKVLIINHKKDREKLRDFDPIYLICQKYIDFNMGDEYSWWGYRDSSGKLLSVVANHKDKFPDKFGRITNAKIVENLDVKRIGDYIVEKLGYIGIADIQFIFDIKTNSYFVIEMNPRLWCSHELLLMNNINFIRSCVEDFYNGGGTLNNEQCFELSTHGSGTEWFSILHYIKKLKSFDFRNTEYYEISKDRIIMRVLAKLFLILKYFYYLFKKTI